MADAPEPPVAPGAELDPPMLPPRSAYLLSFAAVVVAGLLGGIIGFGIADVSGTSGLVTFACALVGALVAATGAGIVAVLVLRAMAEWKRQPRPAPPVRRRS